MAGCCPAVPPSNAVGAALSEANGPESDIRNGETLECYMARAGNTTGLQDDATATIINRITNTAIPIKRTKTTASTNVTFKLTEGSDPSPVTWSMTPVPAGLTFVAATGVLSGNFSSPGQVYKVTVTATFGAFTATSTYTVAPSVGGEDTEIQLISPLPGGIVNSPFGMRVHPITGVRKPHTGIDMKYADRSVKDVVAAADGKVILTGGNPASGYGLRVHIKHSTGSGAHLCTTTYNHLNKIYVADGQTVMAGQKIGLEGTTGSSTGNHLHFECKLPDGKFIDPEPLIRGSLTVASQTAPNGDPAGTMVTRTSEASLSADEVQARTAGCEPFGPSYPPSTPPETTDVPTSGATDPFELAWFFCLTHEVGPTWSAASPSDPDVIGGFIDTAARRKKVGYVSLPNFPGGETKFGIAQHPNPTTKVTTIGYAEATQVAFNGYWKGSIVPSTGSLLTNAPLVSIMLFDMNFLHGQGNVEKMWSTASLNITGPKTQAEQIALCETLTTVRLNFINSLRRRAEFPGWPKRAAENLAYVKSLPPFP